MKANKGDTVFFANLEKKYSQDSYGKIGVVGPYPSALQASEAMDTVVASREGEQLLTMLEVDRIRILQTVVQ